MNNRNQQLIANHLANAAFHLFEAGKIAGANRQNLKKELNPFFDEINKEINEITNDIDKAGAKTEKYTNKILKSNDLFKDLKKSDVFMLPLSNNTNTELLEHLKNSPTSAILSAEEKHFLFNELGKIQDDRPNVLQYHDTETGKDLSIDIEITREELIEFIDSVLKLSEEKKERFIKYFEIERKLVLREIMKKHEIDAKTDASD